MNTHSSLSPMAAGQRYGRLVAIEFVNQSKNAGARWKFICDCGAEKVIRAHDVRTNNTLSCGCLRREVTANRFTRHGHSPAERSTGTYKSWIHAKGRCINPRDAKFKDYGGRGIRMCKQWIESFETFLRDMGERPPGMSIERINNDGNYEPGNCRWATMAEQAGNTRSTILVELNGERFTLAEFARRMGLTPNAVRQAMVYHDFTAEEAVAHLRSK